MAHALLAVSLGIGVTLLWGPAGIAVLIGVWVVLYLVIATIIYRSTFLSASPTIDQLERTHLWEELVEPTRQAEEFGLHYEGAVHIRELTPPVETHMVLLRAPDARIAVALLSYRANPSASDLASPTLAVEVATRIRPADGSPERYMTTNNAASPIEYSTPVDLLRLPDADLTSLMALHRRRLVDATQRGDQALVASTDLQHILATNLREAAQLQIGRKWQRYDPERNSYVPTLRGALVTAWQHSEPPRQHIARKQRRAVAKRIASLPELD